MTATRSDTVTDCASTSADKLSVKCRCCATVITVTTVPEFDGLELYADVLRRGNVVCERCFRGLSR